MFEDDGVFTPCHSDMEGTERVKGREQADQGGGFTKGANSSLVHVNKLGMLKSMPKETGKRGVTSYISMLCSCKLFACSYSISLTLQILQVQINKNEMFLTNVPLST